MYMSFSRASSRFQAGISRTADTGLPRPAPTLTCHHEGSTYQIPHAEPYIPRPALNFPLLLCSLAVAPTLGLFLALGDEAASASGLQATAGPVVSHEASSCRLCFDSHAGNRDNRVTVAQTGNPLGTARPDKQFRE